MFSRKRQWGWPGRMLVLGTVWAFALNLITTPFPAMARQLPALDLPAPGTMLPLSQDFAPPVLRGLTLYPGNPLKFDFIVDFGDSSLQGDDRHLEANTLIKYFLAALTVPEKELWVNLSPYEADRMIPEAFGQTDMGRDLLAQDYLLKQLTASLMYPEEPLGQTFWAGVYDRVYRECGMTRVQLETFNKIWIVPKTAAVYEHGNSVFITESRLEVMLEDDYLALEKALGLAQTGTPDSFDDNDAGTGRAIIRQAVRDVLIPQIEREVNSGETFVRLRQIYDAMILALWYKNKLKTSLLGQVYADQNKVKGIDGSDEKQNQRIYEHYLEAFQKGVYNYIKEDYDPVSREPILRKYFSGGFGMRTKDDRPLSTIIRNASVANRNDLGPNADTYTAEIHEVSSGEVKEQGGRYFPGLMTAATNDVGASIVVRAEDGYPIGRAEYAGNFQKSGKIFAAQKDSHGFYQQGLYPPSKESALVHTQTTDEPHYLHHQGVHIWNSGYRGKRVVMENVRLDGRLVTVVLDDHLGNPFSNNGALVDITDPESALNIDPKFAPGQDPAAELEKLAGQAGGLQIDLMNWISPGGVNGKNYKMFYYKEIADKENEQYRSLTTEEQKNDFAEEILKKYNRDMFIVREIEEDGVERMILLRRADIGLPSQDQVVLNLWHPRVQAYWIGAVKQLADRGVTSLRVDLAGRLLNKSLQEYKQYITEEQEQDILRFYRQEYHRDDMTLEDITGSGIPLEMEPMYRIIHASRDYQVQQGRKPLDWVMEIYDNTDAKGVERYWAMAPEVKVYEIQLFEAFRDGDAGKFAQQLQKVLRHPGRYALIISGFDEKSLVQMKKSGEGFLMMSLAMAHRGELVMIDLREWMGHYGLFNTIPGGINRETGEITHPFALPDELPLRQDADSMINGIKNGPVAHVMTQFKKMVPPGQVINPRVREQGGRVYVTFEVIPDGHATGMQTISVGMNFHPRREMIAGDDLDYQIRKAEEGGKRFVRELPGGRGVTGDRFAVEGHILRDRSYVKIYDEWTIERVQSINFDFSAEHFSTEEKGKHFARVWDGITYQVEHGDEYWAQGLYQMYGRFYSRTEEGKAVFSELMQQLWHSPDGRFRAGVEWLFLKDARLREIYVDREFRDVTNPAGTNGRGAGDLVEFYRTYYAHSPGGRVFFRMLIDRLAKDKNFQTGVQDLRDQDGFPFADEHPRIVSAYAIRLKDSRIVPEDEGRIDFDVEFDRPLSRADVDRLVTDGVLSWDVWVEDGKGVEVKSDGWQVLEVRGSGITWQSGQEDTGVMGTVFRFGIPFVAHEPGAIKLAPYAENRTDQQGDGAKRWATANEPDAVVIVRGFSALMIENFGETDGAVDRMADEIRKRARQHDPFWAQDLRDVYHNHFARSAGTKDAFVTLMQQLLKEDGNVRRGLEWIIQEDAEMVSDYVQRITEETLRQVGTDDHWADDLWQASEELYSKSDGGKRVLKAVVKALLARSSGADNLSEGVTWLQSRGDGFLRLRDFEILAASEIGAGTVDVIAGEENYFYFNVKTNESFSREEFLNHFQRSEFSIHAQLEGDAGAEIFPHDVRVAEIHQDRDMVWRSSQPGYHGQRGNVFRLQVPFKAARAGRLKISPYVKDNGQNVSLSAASGEGEGIRMVVRRPPARQRLPDAADRESALDAIVAETEASVWQDDTTWPRRLYLEYLQNYKSSDRGRSFFTAAMKRLLESRDDNIQRGVSWILSRKEFFGKTVVYTEAEMADLRQSEWDWGRGDAERQIAPGERVRVGNGHPFFVTVRNEETGDAREIPALLTMEGSFAAVFPSLTEGKYFVTFRWPQQDGQEKWEGREYPLLVGPAAAEPVGGINLDPAALDLQIKRDDNGVPLPLFDQPIEDMRIEGFIPVIINVTPTNIPLLLGNAEPSDAEQQLSFVP